MLHGQGVPSRELKRLQYKRLFVHCDERTLTDQYFQIVGKLLSVHTDVKAKEFERGSIL
jgi:hypothetical protein